MTAGGPVEPAAHQAGEPEQPAARSGGGAAEQPLQPGQSAAPAAGESAQPGSGRPVAPRAKEPGQLRKRLRHLPSGLLASAALLVLGLIIGGLARGTVGALGAAAGVGLVALSYTVSSVVIAWADARDPRLVLPFGLLTYVMKFTIIGFVMAAIDARGWRGLAPMGIAIIVTALGWTVAQAVWTWRARIPYVEILPPQ